MKFVLWGLENMSNHWFRKWLGAITNSLCSGDVIWRHRIGSTLAQAMACYLEAPSHYLNQCLSVRSCDIHLMAISQEMLKIAVIDMSLKFINLRLQLHFHGANGLIDPMLTHIYSISQEICTRFCCALLCCGYAIVHNEFTWSIYPYSSGLLCWHWGNR